MSSMKNLALKTLCNQVFKDSTIWLHLVVSYVFLTNSSVFFLALQKLVALCQDISTFSSCLFFSVLPLYIWTIIFLMCTWECLGTKHISYC